MVKTYNCSCNRNMYLWWCSNVYKRLQSFIWRYFLLCLSQVLPWDWQQCAAWGGEIWLHLTGMICPRAGNWMANFWRKPNPRPMPCPPPPRHYIDRCIRKTLASIFHLWLFEVFSWFQNGSILLVNASCKRRALIIEDKFKILTFADYCKPSYL